MARELNPAKILQSEHHLFDSCAGQSDMSCALIVASFIEHAIQSLLKKYLLDDESKASTFFKVPNERGVQLAYCLGLIDKPMLDNLVTIGKIRNDFAHAKEPVDFNNNDVVTKCNTLTLPKIIGQINRSNPMEPIPATPLPGKMNDPANMSVRERFMQVAVMIYRKLILRALSTKHLTCIEEWGFLEIAELKEGIYHITHGILDGRFPVKPDDSGTRLQ